MKFFAVVGGIGSGKSTLWRVLVDMLRAQGYVVFELKEDVDAMTEQEVEGGTVNMLDLSYQQPEKYKGLAQINFYALRYFAHVEVLAEAAKYEKEHPEAKVLVVSERCGSCDEIFFNLGRKAGLIDDAAAATYNLIRKFRPLAVPDRYIYLRTDPEVCKARVDERKREEEEGIPLDFLQDLHWKDEAMYIGNPRTLVIDNNLHVDKEVRHSPNHPHANTVCLDVAAITA
jgi:deoxycitidine kinase